MNTVFFDLGNVLIFFSLEKMFDQLAACMSVPVVTLRDHSQRERLAEQYEVGKLTSEQVYKSLQKLAPSRFSFQEMMHAMGNIFTPNTQLWPIVETLHMQGARLVLLSNTNECHFQFAYAAFPILRLFDHYVLSYQVGARKPDAEIFKRALQEAKGEKRFYTDDIPAFVEAGRSVGLDAEVFHDVPTLKQQLIEREILRKD